jgi:type IV secretion system protein VirD4
VIADLGRFADENAPEIREVRSIASNATTHLGWIGNRLIADSMSASTIDFKEMRNRPMTVYVGGTGQHTASAMPWIRVITNSWANACLQNGRGNIPVLGILNEFKTSVGRLNSIETLLAMGAGYGVQLIVVLQDLPQLQDLYPKSWESWLANSGFQIYLRPREWTTSEYVSKMAGMVEVHSLSKNFSQRDSVSRSSQSRRYLLPEQIRELSENEMLIFAAGVPGVIRAGRRPYWECPEFEGKFDPDPFHPEDK